MVMLDRHQERREAGLPTVSVLSGGAGLTMGAGRRWAELRGRSVVVAAVDDPRPDVLSEAWIDALAAARDLGQDAVAWLARRLDRPAAELGPAIGRKTSWERDAFLDAVLPGGSAPDVEAAGRWLLAQPAEAARVPGLAVRLGAALGGASQERVVQALHGLIPEGAAPVLLVVGAAAVNESAAWVDAAAQSLARLAEAEPRLPLLLAIEPEVLSAYHASVPESRTRALIRAGTISIAALDATEIGRRLDKAIPGAAQQLAGPIRRLAADGASEELVDRFREAARAAAPGPGSEPEFDDLARSAAERFLYERLDTLPQTAGLFALNARLDFPFGPARMMEVDLVARGLALAVEIDGYYHFRNADAYRRDRRKDLELQKQGFLVVRVLAEDVVARLEEVLDLILAAVATARAKSHEPIA
jgi:hypothetical protein